MTVKKKQTAKVKPGTSKQSAEDRRKIFVETYIANGGNATDAAKTAGYSEKTARSQGARLLTDVNIQALIKSRKEKLAVKYELTTENIIAELSKIVHADLRKVFNEDGSLKALSDWPEDIAAAIGSVEVEELFDGNGKDRKKIGYTKKLKLWDKNSAIEKAMKYLGLFEKDNAQRNPFADMSDEMLDKVIAAKAVESGLKLH